jgi:hypothetical protein
MSQKPPVEDRIVRHLKGMVTLCDEARGFTSQESTLDGLLRDLALKAGEALLVIRKEPLKA